ncbi:g2705 [Coccomyxa viridis]|uniref:G2705 protein n=1 Tax=Coccomyxa viridis TaxID=1274662 RepID=A0ABP1FL16_9CHLO
MRVRWKRRGNNHRQVHLPENLLPEAQLSTRLGVSFCCTAALICLLAVGWLWRPQTMTSGFATVIDGDTLDVGGSRVRLQGIDAPERDQTCRDRRGRLYRCGDVSTGELKRLVRLRKVLCKRSGLDRYQRFLGDCWAQPVLWGAPVDLSAAMVASGNAVVYRHFRGRAVAHLLDQQARAKQQKLGMWQGTFQDPQDWKNDRRHQHTSAK